MHCREGEVSAHTVKNALEICIKILKIHVLWSGNSPSRNLSGGEYVKLQKIVYRNGPGVITCNSRYNWKQPYSWRIRSRLRKLQYIRRIKRTQPFKMMSFSSFDFDSPASFCPLPDSRTRFSKRTVISSATLLLATFRLLSRFGLVWFHFKQ